MEGDRNKYVMSVELAMQREMAFRKKTESLKAEQCSNTTLPSLVQTLGPTPNPYHPTQVTISIARPTLYTRPTNPPCSRLTRPSRPTYDQSHHQHRKPASHHQAKRLKLHSPEDFYCNLCQVDCNSEINLRMHLKGQKHKSLLRNSQVANRVIVGGTSNAKDKVYCELCGICCSDAQCFSLHLNGKNHYLKLRAREMKLKGSDGATTMP